MGSATTTRSPIRGGVGDEGLTPEEVAGNGTKVIKGREVCDDDGESREEVEQGDYGGSVRDGAYGGVKMVNGCGPI